MVTIVTIGMKAEGIVIAASDLGFNSTVALDTVGTKTVKGISFTFEKGNSQTAPAYNAVASEIRLYGGSKNLPEGNTMTISGKKLTSIKLSNGSNCTWGELKVSTGSISVDASHVATWTGDAESVSITVLRGTSATQFRFKTITINGNDSTTTEDPDYTNVASIEEFYNAPSKSQIKFKNQLNVVFQLGNNLLVTDASKYTMLIYGSTGNSYKNGDVIPSGATGTKSEFNGIAQLATPLSIPAAKGTTTVAPYKTRVSELADIEPYQYTYVEVDSVNLLNDPNNANVRNYQVKQGDATFNVFDSFYVNYSNNARVTEPVDSIKYNVTGALTSNKGTLQLALISFTPVGAKEEISGLKSIKDFYSQASGSEVTFANALTVVFQKGSNLIVTDESGYSMLVYGSVGKTYKQGDLIPAGAKGKVGAYGGVAQLTSPSEFGNATGTGSVKPLQVTVAQLPKVEPYYYTYVKLSNVEFTNDSNNPTKIRYYQVKQRDAVFTVYDNYFMNQENKNSTERIVELQENKTYNVTGVLSAYNGSLQLNLLSFEVSGSSAVDSLNVDEADVPAVYYNLNGVQVSETNLTPGIYVCKQGNKVSKVLVK